MALTLAQPLLPLLLAASADSMPAPSPRSPRPATKRLQLGQERFASLVAYWLKQSDVSLRQFCQIIDWAVGEPGWIGNGQLSQMSRGNVQKVSIKYLQAFAATNHAIWLWHTHGPDRAIRELGPHSIWGVDPAWMNSAAWLPAPDQPDCELNLGDLAEVLAGNLELPYVATQLSPREGVLMSKELAHLLGQLAGDLNLPPRDAIEALLAAYPSADSQRRRLIRDLILGDAELTTEEMTEELAGLAEMVRVIRKLPVGDYGPAELRAELVAKRRRS